MAVHRLHDLFIATQRLLPHHGLSRLVGHLANAKTSWIKKALIREFVALYDVDLSEAEKENPEDYDSFNDFFTRALKHDARPIDSSPESIISPVDGTVGQIGTIDGGRLIQAKGKHFTLQELLGGDKDLARRFENGRFATIYLSPNNYHRVHMPIAGDLLKARYIAGKLFSVNESAAKQIRGLYARNERLVCHFDTAAGPCALIMVGAMLVAGIETVWSGGLIRPKSTATITPSRIPYTLRKGDEMGRFCFGSTVILLFGRNSIRWCNQLTAGNIARMGSTIGRIDRTS